MELNGVCGFHSRAESATMALAASLVRDPHPGDVVALFGDLGAGKSRFVEGACRELGVQGRVRSPSYTLLNVYRARCPVYHFDLYRWDAAAHAVEWEEWEEWIDGDGISFIEWADRLGEELPERALRVQIEHDGGDRRRLSVWAAQDHHVRRVEALRTRVRQGRIPGLEWRANAPQEGS